MGQRSDYIAQLEAEVAAKRHDQSVLRRWQVAAVSAGITAGALLSALIGVVV